MITFCISSMTGSSMSYIKSNSRKLFFKEKALSFLSLSLKFRFFIAYQSFNDGGMSRIKPQLKKGLSTKKFCVKLNIHNKLNAKLFLLSCSKTFDFQGFIIFRNYFVVKLIFGFPACCSWFIKRKLSQNSSGFSASKMVLGALVVQRLTSLLGTLTLPEVICWIFESSNSDASKAFIEKSFFLISIS